MSLATQLKAAIEAADRKGALDGNTRERIAELVKAKKGREALELVQGLVESARDQDPNSMDDERFDSWVRTRPWVAMRSNRLEGRVVVVLLDEARYEEARRAWPDAAVLTLAEGLELADRQPSDATLTLLVDTLKTFGGRLSGGPSLN